GGDFGLVGGLARLNLARMNQDGNLDLTWAPDPDGPVDALAVSATDIFVGGQFATLGGSNRMHLAKLPMFGNDKVDPDWDAGLTSVSVVQALAVNGTNLFVGGSFTNSVGGQNRNALARLSTSGSGDADGMWEVDTEPGGAVTCLVLSGTNLYIGGSFSAV